MTAARHPGPGPIFDPTAIWRDICSFLPSSLQHVCAVRCTAVGALALQRSSSYTWTENALETTQQFTYVSCLHCSVREQHTKKQCQCFHFCFFLCSQFTLDNIFSLCTTAPTSSSWFFLRTYLSCTLYTCVYTMICHSWHTYADAVVSGPCVRSVFKSNII